MALRHKTARRSPHSPLTLPLTLPQPSLSLSHPHTIPRPSSIVRIGFNLIELEHARVVFMLLIHSFDWWVLGRGRQAWGGCWCVLFLSSLVSVSQSGHSPHLHRICHPACTYQSLSLSTPIPPSYCCLTSTSGTPISMIEMTFMRHVVAVMSVCIARGVCLSAHEAVSHVV